MENVALTSLLNKMRMPAALAGLCLLVPLTGCPFFQCEGKSDCGTGSTSTGTGDYVYVSNSTTGSEYINGYTVGTGTLTAITGSPFLVNFVPVAMAVSKNDNFLYVAAPPGNSSSGVWMYQISSTGALTGGAQENSDLIGAMALSPDGNFLFEIDSGTGTIITEYETNTSTGALTKVNTFTAPGTSAIGCALTATTPVSQNCSIAVAPTNDYVAVTLNTVGMAIYPYTSSGGITSSNYVPVAPPSTVTGDYSLAFDDSDHLYVSSTAELISYGTLSASAQPAVITTYTGYTSGATPRSVILSTAYNYVFTADEGTSQIQAFTVSGGSLAAFATAAFPGPMDVSALGVDRSGSYLLAAGYNAGSGLQMYPISATTLSAVASEGTAASTSIPVVMALTH